MKLNKPGEAFEDAGKAIELDGSFVRGYIRRAQAGVALGDKDHVEGAIRDYNKAKECVSAARTTAAAARPASRF